MLVTHARPMAISIRILLLISLSLLTLSCNDGSVSRQDPYAGEAATEDSPPSSSREGVLWELQEWTVQNASYSGNPFDVVATVTFEHQGSGKTHETEMFYDGDDIWKYRFTGTRTGTWTYTTTSDDPELNGRSGTITVLENPDPEARGFVTTQGNKWAWQKDGSGTVKTFVPHFRLTFDERVPMEDHTDEYIGHALDLSMRDEGFNGIFKFMAAQWVDAGTLDENSWTSTSNRNPDLTSFEALERIIQMVHARGGAVHIWYVGDCARDQCTQAGFGDNGASTKGERRLLRYIAARLGPLPGWVMGYGYDNNEHVHTSALEGWGTYLWNQMGWMHLLTARDQNKTDQPYTFWPGANWHSKGEYFGGAPYSKIRAQLTSDMDVSHSFDERWWKGRLDSEEAILRQLWTLNMAGGASAIFGWDGFLGTNPYPHPEWFKTFFTFWKDRFHDGMTPENSLTDGYALKNASSERLVVYKEGTSSIQIDLSSASGNLSAVAVDTKSRYEEVGLGSLEPVDQTIEFSYSSDWAIAIGNF